MSILSRLFSKKPKLANDGFVNPIFTELHSHLLPGIDDGVQTLEESILVLKKFEELGYKKVITTPHIMGDLYKNDSHNIIPLLNKVKQSLKDEGIAIELCAAAEYMVDDGFQAKIDKKELLYFGNKYVLIEMPFMEPAPNLKEVLFALRVNGYKPVLAHPERYVYYGYNKKHYEELWDAEVLFQLNINSLVGFYSPQVQKVAEYLVDQKMVSLVGSDTHGMRYLPALEIALQTEYYEKICQLTLLNNTF